MWRQVVQDIIILFFIIFCFQLLFFQVVNLQNQCFIFSENNEIASEQDMSSMTGIHKLRTRELVIMMLMMTNLYDYKLQMCPSL